MLYFCLSHILLVEIEFRRFLIFDISEQRLDIQYYQYAFYDAEGDQIQIYAGDAVCRHKIEADRSS